MIPRPGSHFPVGPCEGIMESSVDPPPWQQTPLLLCRMVLISRYASICHAGCAEVCQDSVNWASDSFWVLGWSQVSELFSPIALRWHPIPAGHRLPLEHVPLTRSSHPRRTLARNHPALVSRREEPWVFLLLSGEERSCSCTSVSSLALGGWEGGCVAAWLLFFLAFLSHQGCQEVTAMQVCAVWVMAAVLGTPVLTPWVSRKTGGGSGWWAAGSVLLPWPGGHVSPREGPGNRSSTAIRPM